MIKEENLDPENHSGAVPGVFWPFFGPQRTQILCSDQEYNPSVMGVAFGGHLGPFLGEWGAILGLFHSPKFKIEQKVIMEILSR